MFVVTDLEARVIADDAYCILCVQWTVNGQLRIGFFTIKHVKAGEEITFNYQFETYG